MVPILADLFKAQVGKLEPKPDMGVDPMAVTSIDSPELEHCP
jgi:hypothetical protein